MSNYGSPEHVFQSGFVTPVGTPQGSPMNVSDSPPTNRKAFLTPEKTNSFYPIAQRLMNRENGEIKGTSSIMFNNGERITKFARSNLKNTATNRERVEMLLREFFLAQKAGELDLGPKVHTNPSNSIMYDPQTREYFLVIQMDKLEPLEPDRTKQNKINLREQPQFQELYRSLKNSGFNVNRDFHTGQILVKGGKFKYINYGRVKPTGKLKKKINKLVQEKAKSIFRSPIKTRLFSS